MEILLLQPLIDIAILHMLRLIGLFLIDFSALGQNTEIFLSIAQQFFLYN